ncbi:hypothetical protein SISNIDRAFT_489838 [Sistotremastrum niveocremeum HHB9708]|uniref:Cryptic loci regulator 2 N-terminal domain-containing protein n=2 Tax=Sistotremastraceae TaxID=3402574 RepID=A0A164PK48_9AGAM|nr:hypothetical protein SISNIDRAFT_489838 [Sistotremastrum niveocremeum HHB9708]KZT35818.1 hypothetical protein SISSUDRAFT_1064193 [Sistotremastrum suecicum HHB10207 ss-3]
MPFNFGAYKAGELAPLKKSEAKQTFEPLERLNSEENNSLYGQKAPKKQVLQEFSGPDGSGAIMTSNPPSKNLKIGTQIVKPLKPQGTPFPNPNNHLSTSNTTSELVRRPISSPNELGPPAAEFQTLHYHRAGRELGFRTSDGPSKKLPAFNRSSGRYLDQMRELGPQDELYQHWLSKIGNYVATKVLHIPGADLFEMTMTSFPEHYKLFVREKGDQHSFRRDAYLYGSAKVTQFRSPEEFYRHAEHLITGKPCRCKYCFNGGCRARLGVETQALAPVTNRVLSVRSPPHSPNSPIGSPSYSTSSSTSSSPSPTTPKAFSIHNSTVIINNYGPPITADDFRCITESSSRNSLRR